MKSIIFLLSLSFSVVISAKPLHEVGIFINDRSDIDYQTNTSSVSASTITAVGLIGCSYDKVTGETRINSFNNIFAISSIFNNPWHDYQADKTACKYGLKLPLAGGSLKAGIGYQDYDGQTELTAGGKSIHMIGKGLDVSYTKEQNTLHLKHTRKYADLMARFASYDNFADLKENTTLITFNNKDINLQLEDTVGNRIDVYTTILFPTNEFDYRYQTLEIGKTFKADKNHSFYLAPIFINGSQRGTFNPLETKHTFHGLHLNYQQDGATYTLKILDFEGNGDRPYQPVTDRLYETKKTSSYQLEYKNTDWQVSLENRKSHHVGTIYITSATVYESLVSGSGLFNNSRKQDKWTLDIKYALTKQSSIAMQYYHATINDHQYTYAPHNYTENGTSITFNTGF